MDLRRFIKRVNELKAGHALLQGEGVLRAVGGLGGDTLVLERHAADTPAAARGWILVNKLKDEAGEVPLAELAPESQKEGEYRLFRVCRDDAAEEGDPVGTAVALERAEVAYVLPVGGIPLYPSPVLNEERY